MSPAATTFTAGAGTREVTGPVGLVGATLLPLKCTAWWVPEEHAVSTSSNAKVTTRRIEALQRRVTERRRGSCSNDRRSTHEPLSSVGTMAELEARTEKNLVAHPVLSLNNGRATVE